MSAVSSSKHTRLEAAWRPLELPGSRSVGMRGEDESDAGWGGVGAAAARRQRDGEGAGAGIPVAEDAGRGGACDAG
jgi:hypothetical protein